MGGGASPLFRSRYFFVKMAAQLQAKLGGARLHHPITDFTKGGMVGHRSPEAAISPVPIV
jgi:hypothetical protein